MKYFLGILSLLILAGNLPAMEQKKISLEPIAVNETKKGKTSVLDYAKNGAISYAKAYSLAYGLVFGHELGHAVANRLLFGFRSIIWVNPKSILPCTGWALPYNKPLREMLSPCLAHISPRMTHKDINNCLISLLKEFTAVKYLIDKHPWKHACTFAAGPLFGFAANYGVLKGSTLLTEYNRNGKQLDKAWEYAKQQPLFNKDQSIITQLIVAFSVFQNWNSLYPNGDPKCNRLDGNKMFKALEISNPRPKIRKTIGIASEIALAGWLLNSIYQVKK